MKRWNELFRGMCITVVTLTLLLGAGCATKGQTGALTGAGAGALIGGLANMHGSWGATALIGAGVGAGVGYLIGNEEDKKGCCETSGSNRSRDKAARRNDLAGDQHCAKTRKRI
jgi:hypothetical protein